VSNFEDRAFLVLLAAVSLAFAWILWPFYAALLWAVVFATVFAPAHARLLNSMLGHPNVAALTAVLLILTLVLLPLTLTAMSVGQEATSLYEKIETGELDFGRFLTQLLQALPAWATELLNRIGINDIADVQARLSAAVKQGSEFIATQAIAIGQGTAHIVVSFFLMLYLLFFFLRDGRELSQRLKEAIPLRAEQKRALFSKFAIVIRAMFKGTILVALLQACWAD
jgi:predicted PurR-regulated permease PerM